MSDKQEYSQKIFSLALDARGKLSELETLITLHGPPLVHPEMTAECVRESRLMCESIKRILNGEERL
jgi:hypothetical protein